MPGSLSKYATRIFPLAPFGTSTMLAKERRREGLPPSGLPSDEDEVCRARAWSVGTWGNVESRRVLARVSKGLVERWESRLWLATLSTARIPQFFYAVLAARAALGLEERRL